MLGELSRINFDPKMVPSDNFSILYYRLALWVGHLTTKPDLGMGQGGGEFDHLKFQKFECPGGGGGGMVTFRIDRYITQH